jgi:hypothetical protein
MFDSSNLLADYTPEQALYIKEYAAGLLISWTKEHIDHLISPDVGDGFHPAEGVFPTEEKEWDAHSAVCRVLDDWMADVATQAGFRSMEDLDAIPLVAEKYPTLPPQH